MPVCDPDQVDGSGCDDVLQMGLCQPDISASPQSAATDRLRVCAFDPGARSIVLLEFLRRLMPASGLQRLVVFARLKPEIRGSFLARVKGVRNGHGVQSFRANRASNIMPFSGQVFGSHEMLCLPAGQVTTSIPVTRN